MHWKMNTYCPLIKFTFAKKLSGCEVGCVVGGVAGFVVGWRGWVCGWGLRLGVCWVEGLGGERSASTAVEGIRGPGWGPRPRMPSAAAWKSSFPG